MNSSDIFFSVIIPLFNKEKYIARAVESVLNQSISNFEVIIVDDGSSDNSVSEIQKFLPHIKIIQQGNKGVSAARNAGIKAASYDYLAFLDADDEWKPNFLIEMKRLILKYPSAGAYCCRREHIDTVLGNRGVFPDVAIPGDELVVDRFFKFTIENNDYPESSSSTVVPRSTLDKVGQFPLNEPIREDVDLWTRISLAYDVILSPQVCSIIHTHTDNNSRKCSREREYKGGLQVVNTMKNALQTGKVREIDVSYAERFFELCQIGCAVINIRGGNPSQGRKYLRSIKSQYYLQKKLLWYMISFLPLWLIEKMIRMSH